MEKIKLFFKDSPTRNSHQFRGIGIYTKELLEKLKTSKSITLVKDKKSADIIHIPYFSPFIKISPQYLSKTIFTIHDLVPLELNSLFPKGIKSTLNWLHNKFNLKRALHIITDSNASKKQIQKILKLPATKVTSIYLAPQSSLKTTNGPIKPENFCLYVGDINPNKNIKRITNACLKLSIPLYIVGKSANQEILNPSHPELKDLVWLQKMAKENPKKIKLLGFIPDQKLELLYQQALVCLQPSLAEGFGLPVLEALKIGCPVITSNISSQPEIAGDAAILVDPYNQTDIQKAILKIKSLSTNQRIKLVKKGKLQAKKFSWNKTVAQTIKTYQHVLQD